MERSRQRSRLQRGRGTWQRAPRCTGALCRREWKHALLTPGDLCPESFFLYDSASCPLLLDSVLVEDALVRHNFNGVSCYSFRGVASQRH